MGKAATTTYKHLAQLLCEKWSSPYSVIMGWLCYSLGFSLVWSSIMCIRGSCSRLRRPYVPPAVDLTVAERHVSVQNYSVLYFMFLVLLFLCKCHIKHFTAKNYKAQWITFTAKQTVPVQTPDTKPALTHV